MKYLYPNFYWIGNPWIYPILNKCNVMTLFENSKDLLEQKYSTVMRGIAFLFLFFCLIIPRCAHISWRCSNLYAWADITGAEGGLNWKATSKFLTLSLIWEMRCRTCKKEPQLCSCGKNPVTFWQSKGTSEESNIRERLLWYLLAFVIKVTLFLLCSNS